MRGPCACLRPVEIFPKGHHGTPTESLFDEDKHKAPTLLPIHSLSLHLYNYSIPVGEQRSGHDAMTLRGLSRRGAIKCLAHPAAVAHFIAKTSPHLQHPSRKSTLQ